jgi:hypothetical protein
MKVDKKKTESFYILWLLAGTYHKCVANSTKNKKKLQNLAKLAHFILCIGRNHIFQVENSPGNETLVRP